MVSNTQRCSKFCTAVQGDFAPRPGGACRRGAADLFLAEIVSSLPALRVVFTIRNEWSPLPPLQLFYSNFTVLL